MQDFAAHIELWRKKWEKSAVLSGIFVVFAALLAASLWKYDIFGYRGFDLAYFSQVFWNTVHGRFFEQSLHPHLSLGDHAELAIVPLSLVYALWQDARMLLLMQAAALAACAWPLWRIAKFRLAASVGAGGGTGAGASVAAAFLPLALVAAFLLNPSLHHIGLFEFHVLAFAIFPLLMAVLAYEIGNKRAFVLWCVAALLVREDVSMVVFMFGALAWMERRSRWWRVVPAAMGAAWFVAAMLLVAHFAPADSYKFRVYYAWLGETPLAMLTFPFRHPLQFAVHFFTLGNLDMFLGLLMPFAALPLLRPRRLLLALGPLAQILLAAPGGGEIVVRTHYAVLFLPALALACIEGLTVAPAWLRRRLPLLQHTDPAGVVAVLLLACATYSFAAMSPLPRAAWLAATDKESRVRAAEYRELLRHIPKDASVSASYALLPALSSRQTLVSLHYVALGVTQFGEQPYVAPETRFTALDAEDLLLYDAQFSVTKWAQPHQAGLHERIKANLGPPVYTNGSLTLYDREKFDFSMPMPELLSAAPPEGTIALNALVVADEAGERRLRLTTSLGWWEPPTGAAIEYVVTDAQGATLLARTMPVQGPLPWTTGNGGTTLHYEIALPAEMPAPHSVEARIQTISGANMLDDVNVPRLNITERTTLRSATADISWEQ